MVDSKHTAVSGTLSTPASVGLVFTPAPNAPFYAQLGGACAGASHYLTQSVAGGTHALALATDGKTPLQLYSPGATLINPPYTAPGAVPPTYRLVLKTIVSGAANYTLYQ